MNLKLIAAACALSLNFATMQAETDQVATEINQTAQEVTKASTSSFTRQDLATASKLSTAVGLAAASFQAFNKYHSLTSLTEPSSKAALIITNLLNTALEQDSLAADVMDILAQLKKGKFNHYDHNYSSTSYANPSIDYGQVVNSLAEILIKKISLRASKILSPLEEQRLTRRAIRSLLAATLLVAHRVANQSIENNSLPAISDIPFIAFFIAMIFAQNLAHEGIGELIIRCAKAEDATPALANIELAADDAQQNGTLENQAAALA